MRNISQGCILSKPLDWIGYVLQAATTTPSIGSQKWVGTSHSGDEIVCCHGAMKINLLLSKAAVGRPSLEEGDFMHVKGSWQLLPFTAFQFSKKGLYALKKLVLSGIMVASAFRLVLAGSLVRKFRFAHAWRLRVRIRSLQP